MISILPLGNKFLKKVKKFGLENKLNKQLILFSKDPYYPSLRTELLEPKEYGESIVSGLAENFVPAPYLFLEMIKKLLRLSILSLIINEKQSFCL